MRRLQITTFSVVLIGLAFLLMAGTGEAATCCTRQLAMMPIDMPVGQKTDLNAFIEGLVIGTLMDQTLGLMAAMPEASCPEIEFYDIEAKVRAQQLADAIAAAAARQRNWTVPEPWPAPPEWDLDYIFRGTLKADRVTGASEWVCEEGYDPGTEYCTGGHLQGSFTFTLKLLDHHHGDAILSEGSVSWSGSILEGLGFWREGGADASPIRLLVNAFMPLQTLIKEYERIPETATIALPTDVVGAGETVTVTLSDLLDEAGRQTQPWQRLLVRVEKGTILNGENDQEVTEGYHVFRAGPEGVARVQYRAPAECVRQREILKVHNTCNKVENKGDAKASSAPSTELARQEFEIVCDRWELEIAYHEQVSYNNREERGDATWEDHITGTLDYRITATLRPASWQPADALRPYQAKEEEAKARFAQPRPDDVPSTIGEQLEKIEREEAQVRQRANEVVGPGGMHDFIALGVGLQLKDYYLHTKNDTLVSENGRFEDDRRWEWHADQRGPIPLNIHLRTYANKNRYHITLTDHDPMDTGNPESHHPFTIPWRYVFRRTRTGQSPLDCSGTVEVESPGNFPHNVFADVPDDKLAYDGSQRVLRGEHSWTESVSQLDVSRTETPGCAERRALGNFNRALPKDSVTKTLRWTLRRLGGPSGP